MDKVLSDKRLLIQVSVIYLVFLLTSILCLFFSDFNTFLGILAGATISTVFVLSHYMVFKFIRKVDNAKFTRWYMYSMLARFLAVLLTIIVVLKRVEISILGFTLSLVVSYILLSFSEIFYINRTLDSL